MLTNNFGWKLGSLLIAVLLWFAIIGEPELVTTHMFPILYRNLPPELLLFHEGPSRILVSTPNPEEVFRLANANGVHAIEIGVTLKARVTISNRGEVLLDERVDELKGLWNNALEHLLHNSVAV